MLFSMRQTISDFVSFLLIVSVIAHSYLTPTRFCKARPKQFCIVSLVRSIPIICILRRISSIRFFVAKMLPRQDHHVSAGLPYGSSTNSKFSCQSFLCSDHQVSFCQPEDQYYENRNQDKHPDQARQGKAEPNLRNLL